MPMPVTVRDTELPGVQIVETGLARDDRGFFSEIYSEPMYAEADFRERFVQDNVSKSARGVLRGLHYQLDPYGMGKLVMPLRGAIFDVAVDLRRGSPTFGQWYGRTLEAEGREALWVPVGFAHGFLSLAGDTLVLYKCSGVHTPEAERSLHFADPQVNIEWPEDPRIVSEKDQAAPSLDEAEYNFTYAV